MLTDRGWKIIQANGTGTWVTWSVHACEMLCGVCRPAGASFTRGRLWKDSDRERQVGNKGGSDKRPTYRKSSIY